MVQLSIIKDAFRSLVQAVVHYRLDYCNAILTGTADAQMKQLQSVKNTARLASGALRRDQVTPLLHSLHWLPRRHSSIFTTALCPSGQRRKSSPTICIDWLHSATTGADINRTAELRFSWSCSVEQSATSPARLQSDTNNNNNNK